MFSSCPAIDWFNGIEWGKLAWNHLLTVHATENGVVTFEAGPGFFVFAAALFVLFVVYKFCAKVSKLFGR